MSREDYLFNKVDWFSVESNQRKTLADEISEMHGDRLLNTSVDDLCNYLVDKHTIEVPTLQKDKIIAGQHEVEIDVSRDLMRDIRDRSKPFYIKGTEIVVTIPFEGEAEVFRVQPLIAMESEARAISRR